MAFAALCCLCLFAICCPLRSLSICPLLHLAALCCLHLCDICCPLPSPLTVLFCRLLSSFVCPWLPFAVSVCWPLLPSGVSICLPFPDLSRDCMLVCACLSIFLSLHTQRDHFISGHAITYATAKVNMQCTSVRIHMNNFGFSCEKVSA